ncbi:MAG: GIY-YIG nuclease family protein, partial [Verrucomicrobia bacterium]|nr:GIY-YIG nuclease family protein [Verrucomicrobiota bacterium]
MSVWIYIIECCDQSLYVGHTRDLHQRMARHLQGIGTQHLSQRGFKRLLYREQQPDEESAIRRELQI